jgi:hypothetical protein
MRIDRALVIRAEEVLRWCFVLLKEPHMDTSSIMLNVIAGKNHLLCFASKFEAPENAYGITPCDEATELIDSGCIDAKMTEEDFIVEVSSWVEENWLYYCGEIGAILATTDTVVIPRTVEVDRDLGHDADPVT